MGDTGEPSLTPDDPNEPRESVSLTLRPPRVSGLWWIRPPLASLGWSTRSTN